MTAHGLPSDAAMLRLGAVASSPYKEIMALAPSTRSLYRSKNPWSKFSLYAANGGHPGIWVICSIAVNRLVLPVILQLGSTILVGMPRFSSAAATKPGSPPTSMTPVPLRRKSSPQVLTIHSTTHSASYNFVSHHLSPCGVTTQAAHSACVRPEYLGWFGFCCQQLKPFQFPAQLLQLLQPLPQLLQQLLQQPQPGQPQEFPGQQLPFCCQLQAGLHPPCICSCCPLHPLQQPPQLPQLAQLFQLLHASQLPLLQGPFMPVQLLQFGPFRQPHWP
mmetsp:Transcript_34662/g.62903  ORF Transcript_34662/g.62903 Transcript_34662/m.62903 type:complete len:275 (-) Transcript_34662:92-916(-)